MAHWSLMRIDGRPAAGEISPGYSPWSLTPCGSNHAKMRMDGSINKEGLLSTVSVFLAAFALLLSKVAIEGIELFPYPTY